jgi:hypothetical protein
VQDRSRRDLLAVGLPLRFMAARNARFWDGWIQLALDHHDVTSQLPPAKWHDQLGNATLVDAILYRVLHGAHRIALKGPSRRKETAEA